MLKEKQSLRFNGSIWCSLDIALRNIDHIFRNEVQQLGLTVIEWYVLRALYESDGQQASQLASEVGRAATSFTPNLDKLQDRGYIVRRPDPGDRRAVLIYLTEKAINEKRTILNLASELDNQIESQFSPDELDCFHNMITVLQSVEIN
jgi:MarR family transcriptional regulator, organic hydroperoxide resistance regulator